ncbi:MAG: DNA-processing protein DprA [Eubacteriaceae bacterium]
MYEREFILWLNLIKKISVKKFYELYNYFDSIEEIYCCDIGHLRACDILTNDNIEDIINSKNNDLLNKHLELLHKSKISYTTIIDEDYPQILKNIHLPPPVLYYLGIIDRDIFNNCISIVGSRNASYYGLKMSEKIAYELASSKINIVSGLAKGIDSKAHIGALKASGKTIAVLGNGVNIIYPKENRYLYNQIKNSGLIISEFPPNTEPKPYNFPRRNRIISGLSLGTLIIEAAKKSGSLITAKYALEQGREVYALPGNINNQNSVGVNLLIKDGAKVVTETIDIIEDIFPMFSFKNLENATKDNIFTAEERAILDLLRNGFNDADKLYEQTNMPIKRINYVLSMLEIDQKIVMFKGKYYIK